MITQAVRDPGLPGLEHSFEPGGLLRTWAPRLAEAGHGAWSLVRARPLRFRHRRARRAIVQLSLELVGPCGHVSIPAAVWWHAPAVRPRAWRSPEAPPEALPAMLSDPVSGARLALFPFDPRLPGLRLAASAGDATMRSTVLRYRPGLSACLRRDADGRSPVVVKVVAPERVADVEALWRRTADAVRTAGVTFPEILSVDPGTGVIAFDHARGTDLADWLGNPDGRIDDAGLRLAASAVRDEWLATGATGRTRHDRSALLLRAASAARLIGDVHPTLGRDAHRRLGALEADRPREVFGPCHGDMKPEHLFVGSAGVCVLDAEECGHGDPFLDEVMLGARLHDGRRTGRFRSEAVFRLLTALHDHPRHTRDAGRDGTRRRRWLRGWASLMIARHHVQTIHEAWSQRAADALAWGDDDA